MAKGDIIIKREPYGANGVPRRILGILYLTVALVMEIANGFNWYELKDHQGVIILAGIGSALLGLGILKDLKFFGTTVVDNRDK